MVRIWGGHSSWVTCSDFYDSGNDNDNNDNIHIYIYTDEQTKH